MSSFLEVETEALAVVERYLDAINARDTDAIRDACNFPHLRIGPDATLTRYEQPSDYSFDSFFSRTGPDGWDYTKWDESRAVFASEKKAHVAVEFTRYRADGSVIGRYFSLYVVTLQDGHWGIQFGSGNG